jgi:hypothetical protein
MWYSIWEEEGRHIVAFAPSTRAKPRVIINAPTGERATVLAARHWAQTARRAVWTAARAARRERQQLLAVARKARREMLAALRAASVKSLKRKLDPVWVSRAESARATRVG